MICMIGRSVPTYWPRYFKADLFPILVCHGLAHVAGWEPYNLHDLAHVSRVGFVLCRSCTTSHNGRWGTRWSTVDHDLSDLSVLGVKPFNDNSIDSSAKNGTNSIDNMRIEQTNRLWTSVTRVRLPQREAFIFLFRVCKRLHLNLSKHARTRFTGKCSSFCRTQPFSSKKSSSLRCTGPALKFNSVEGVRQPVWIPGPIP